MQHGMPQKIRKCDCLISFSQSQDMNIIPDKWSALVQNVLYTTSNIHALQTLRKLVTTLSNYIHNIIIKSRYKCIESNRRVCPK